LIGTTLNGAGNLSNSDNLFVENGSNVDMAVSNIGFLQIRRDSGTSADVIFSDSVINSVLGTMRFESRNDNISLDFPRLTFSQGITNNGTFEIGTGGSGGGTNRTDLVLSGTSW